MMTSLDVAMTKIRKLEEENMELKISVKEAETKISLLEREKRRAKMEMVRLRHVPAQKRERKGTKS